MATKKKMLQAAAGNATGGAGLNVEDVFSTYLFTPNTSGNFSVTNNIDLDGEGGLVWLKQRDVSAHHLLYDTNRGASAGRLASNLDNGEALAGVYFDAFNSDGFAVKDMNGDEMASWTFRKAPKFFDVVTYTGNGLSSNNINHNLGSVPAFIIVKRTDSSSDWWVVARTGNDQYKNDLRLNQTSIGPNSGSFSAASFGNTDTYFNPRSVAGDATLTNASGATYVAYLFAHNDGDGEFGPDGDADIIKCGSYTNSSSGIEVDLGFEPQWLLVKKSSATNNWAIVDTMRSWFDKGSSGDNSEQLRPNLDSSENGEYHPTITPTGFKTYGEGGAGGSSEGTFIYIAIRRGTKVPESADEVFAVDSWSSTTEPAYTSNFPVDMALHRLNASGVNAPSINTRMLGTTKLLTSSTAAESAESNNVFDFMDGWFDPQGFGPFSNYYSWMWRRAPNFFDVVAYTGSNSDQNVSHNLGAVPEMMWVKCRSGFTENWTCYHKDLGNTKEIKLNTTGVPTTSNAWANTTPTDSVFTVDGDYVPVSKANVPYIAYLFASLDGVSKVGSYTGNGGTLSVDCGFTSGARFVLFRNITTSNGDWTFADTERGIASGNDSALNLNDTSAAITNEDFIDPNSSGFTVVNASGFVDSNVNGHTYLFYAIA